MKESSKLFVILCTSLFLFFAIGWGMSTPLNIFVKIVLFLYFIVGCMVCYNERVFD
jgi:hypothetical protein